MNKEDEPRGPLYLRPPLGSHNQISKKMNKEEIHPPPPPPPLPRFLGFRRYGRHTDMSLMCPIKRPLCILSHPNQPHTLLRISGEITGRASCLFFGFGFRKKYYWKSQDPNENEDFPHWFSCFSCGRRKSWNIDHDFYFYCTICKVLFHSGCHKFPRKVTHPYHLHHPLTFTLRNHETRVLSDGNIDESFWNMVLSESNASDPKKYVLVQASGHQSNTDKCTWCGENIQGNWFYRRSICNFCLDISCFQKVLLLNVANPKSHHHPLVFYTRPVLTPCDACGLVNVLDPSYACFQCDYMVHRSCIDLPRVIKITRHQHRLFHTPYLQPITSPCLVCYKTLDVKYGLYSCNQDCSYVVHSTCATHENVWDGKELEWEPEEPDETEDIPPFTKVGAGLIKHFSHKHFLKLEKYDGGRDAEKQCQACILPVSRNFYNCIQCNFSLHEVCAGLLRKMDHALHIHPLVLDPSPWENREHIGCSVCSRKSTGFRYICVKENCGFIDKFHDRFQIDVRCVLVPAYFTHKSHEHPLFISTSYKGDEIICCKNCKEMCHHSYLQCSECNFAMCYHCATIPNEVYYMHDKHPLSLCYGEKGADGMYWCEVCEKEVNPRDWFYTCNQCCITIHLQCVFGCSVYMKPGFTFKYHRSNSDIVRNNNNTRPLCVECGHRCPSNIYYKKNRSAMVACSLNCLVRNADMAKGFCWIWDGGDNTSKKPMRNFTSEIKMRYKLHTMSDSAYYQLLSFSLKPIIFV